MNWIELGAQRQDEELVGTEHKQGNVLVWGESLGSVKVRRARSGEVMCEARLDLVNEENRLRDTNHCCVKVYVSLHSCFYVNTRRCPLSRMSKMHDLCLHVFN